MTDTKRPPADGAVGYGRPPRHTRYQPGESGNPTGGRKPPSAGPLDIDRRMEEVVTVTSKGKPVKMSRYEVELRSVLKRAFDKNLPAMEHLLQLFALHDEPADRAPSAGLHVLHYPAHLPPTMAQLLFDSFGAPPWTPEQVAAKRSDYRKAATAIERRLELEGVYGV